MQRFQQTKHVLGSTAYLTVVLNEGMQPATVFEPLWQQIDIFEQCFSRFMPDSELSQCNHAAGTRHPISTEFRNLVVAARTMAERSGGLYNPFILPALQRAGYKGSWPQPHISDEKLDYQNRIAVDWRELTVGDTWLHIPGNTALDFGGIGKGYLLDQLAESLRIMNITGYWLSLGGDILCAGHDGSGDAWRIGIQHAQHEANTIATVVNHDKKLAVATSGVTKRQGISDTGSWHHIIDPRTGKPANTQVLTATVCADTATSADVIAKCLVIADTEAARTTLQAMHEQNALLQIKSDGKVEIMRLGATWSI
jgi:thiamine biosynthesis lipoprotein